MTESVVTLNIEDIITEDDTPVDNLPSEKQQRLLTEPLYSSWQRPGGGYFLAAANVGIFNSVHLPPIVPDMFLSLDVQVADDWWQKEHRSYFTWEFGKSPEVVIEIVSNRVGEEAGLKFTRYATIGVVFYAIFDPMKFLKGDVLAVYTLRSGRYEKMESCELSPIGLKLDLWDGEFEGKQNSWLRWFDLEGNVIPTGKERAEAERQRAEAECQRAEAERQRAEAEHQRAEAERQRAEAERQRAEAEHQRAEAECQRAEVEHSEKEQALQLVEQERSEKEAALLRAEQLAARLRELGIDPDNL